MQDGTAIVLLVLSILVALVAGWQFWTLFRARKVSQPIGVAHALTVLIATTRAGAIACILAKRRNAWVGFFGHALPATAAYILMIFVAYKWAILVKAASLRLSKARRQGLRRKLYAACAVLCIPMITLSVMAEVVRSGQAWLVVALVYGMLWCIMITASLLYYGYVLYKVLRDVYGGDETSEGRAARVPGTGIIFAAVAMAAASLAHAAELARWLSTKKLDDEMKVAFLICNLVTCIAVMQMYWRGVTKARRRAVRFSADNGDLKEALHDDESESSSTVTSDSHDHPDPQDANTGERRSSSARDIVPYAATRDGAAVGTYSKSVGRSTSSWSDRAAQGLMIPTNSYQSVVFAKSYSSASALGRSVNGPDGL